MSAIYVLLGFVLILLGLRPTRAIACSRLQKHSSNFDKG